MLNNRFHLPGIFITALISFLIVLFLFFEVFKAPNKNLFAPWGDGLKSTYVTLYHIEHDSSYWHLEGMNYPYGESVFFTGTQQPLTNFIKLLKNTKLDVSGYTVGILNIWMLLSFVIGSVFLYLIFRKLELSVWISIIGAVLIMFLSPQWERLGGHYNLAYAYVFPAGIYLGLLFYNKGGFRLSILIGVFMFFMCLKQLYFLVLLGIIILFIFLRIFFSESERFGGKPKILLHLFIQLILPFLLFTLFTSAFDSNLDRTAYPWGFFQSVTRFEGVFLPVNEPYGKFMHIKGNLRLIAYVGLVSSLMFFFIIIRAIITGIKSGFAKSFQITSKPGLNVMFWAGVISLLISFGLPFTLGMESLLNYLGPIRQFRAIGRFIFPFYYILNIVSIYFLYQWISKSSAFYIKFLCLISLAWFAYDASLNMRYNTDKYINNAAYFTDRENLLEENSWLKENDWEQYQVLMPLPFFHIGSENYWIQGHPKNHQQAFYTSLKTGLPMNAVMMSRTSIGESLKNIDLVKEPSEYEILDELENNKPFLLMVTSGVPLPVDQERLVKKAVLVKKYKNFSFYELSIDSLNILNSEYQKSLKEEFLRTNEDAVKDTAIFFIDYNDLPGGKFTGDIAGGRHYFHEVILPDTGWYKFSFYTENIEKDLYPRTRIEVHYCDINNNCPGISYGLAEKIVRFENGKALYEDRFHTSSENQIIRFSYRNKVLNRGEFSIDNFMLRKEGSRVIQKTDGRYYFNNRLIEDVDIDYQYESSEGDSSPGL